VFEYNSSVDYTNGAHPVPNLQYAVNRHPSDVAIAYDAELEELVYLDSILPLHPSQGSGDVGLVGSAFAKSAQAGVGIPVAIDLASAGHNWGWSTCHWIRSCNSATEWVGSACSATLAGVLYRGFCFESAGGSLECGHTMALDGQYGEKPIVFDKAESPNKLPSIEHNFAATGGSLVVLPGSPSSTSTYRCERGAPVRTSGSHVVKRLPIAGCMITSDALYSVTADVHVPEYCSDIASFRPGCMIKGATNFDPMARQSTTCVFGTIGCTDSNAVNFNSDATIDDGNCTNAVYGCTVALETYADVHPGTPGYKSGSHGSAQPGVGVVNELDYALTSKQVLNYSPSATVNHGCILALQGCMDSTALNYDANATINSNSWCIFARPGCMMPDAARASSTYASQGVRDGLATNYDPAATVHRRSACVVARIGCTDSTRHEYDPLATVSAPCQPTEGCLNPRAKNFKCTWRQDDREGCQDETVQTHSRAVCVFGDNPPLPPMPPPPPVPAGKTTIAKPAAVVSFVASGDVSDYDEAKRGAIAQSFADMGGYSRDAITVTVEAASVLLTIQIIFEDEAAADAAASNIASALGSSPASASAVLGITVQSVPVTTSKVVLVVVDREAASAPPAIVIGASAGGGALVLLLAVCAYLIRKRRGRIKREYTIDVEPSDPLPAKEAWVESELNN